MANLNLGDIGKHPKVTGKYETNGLLPFHKLSQWLTYSLIEPLEKVGIKVVDLNQLTALPEYRNGGLLLDIGVIGFKNIKESKIYHDVQSELVVEWRALTISIIDILCENIQKKLNKSPQQLPLCKILQGGTWNAGRKIALQKRKNSSPPILLNIEGSIF